MRVITPIDIFSLQCLLSFVGCTLIAAGERGTLSGKEMEEFVTRLSAEAQHWESVVVFNSAKGEARVEKILKGEVTDTLALHAKVWALYYKTSDVYRNRRNVRYIVAALPSKEVRELDCSGIGGSLEYVIRSIEIDEKDLSVRLIVESYNEVNSYRIPLVAFEQAIHCGRPN